MDQCASLIEHLVGAAVEEAERGRVHVGGEQRAAALPLRRARQHVTGPGHTCCALHVGADEDLHTCDATCTAP